MHHEWVESALLKTSTERNSDWTSSVSVGGKDYIDTIKKQLGSKVQARKVVPAGEGYAIQEEHGDYSHHYDAKKQ